MTWKIRRSGTQFYVLEGQTVRSGPHADRALAEASIATLDPRPLYTQTGWSTADLIDYDADTPSLIAGQVPDYLEFTEQAANPVAPAIDRVRLFAKDADGETKVYVRIFGGNVGKLLDVPDTAKGVVDDNGGFALGVEASGGVVRAPGHTGFARGFATGAGSTIDAAGFRASQASGYAYGGGDIVASNTASFAHGMAGTNCQIAASRPGSFALGYATVGGIIRASSLGGGSFAIGCAYNSGLIEANNFGAFASGYAAGASSTIRATQWGSRAGGHAMAGGDILASQSGALAFGRANIGTISSTQFGALAHGYAYGSGATITANGRGSIAGGIAYVGAGGTVQLRTSAGGAFAHGYSGDTTGSDINASGVGSVVMGWARGGVMNASAAGAVVLGYGRAAMTASGKGSFVLGYSKTNAMTASARGAGAFGYSVTAAITASAINAFQFGGGTNSIALSLQVGAAGSGIHLHGGGAPGAPANGDIWNTGTLVVLRSDGVNITLDQGAAVADAAGGATVDTEARAAINALLARLRTTNLIAT